MFQTTIIFFRKSFDLTLDNSKTESLLILFIKSASHSIHACYHHFGWAITMCYMLNHGILLWTKRAGQRVKLGSPLNSDVFRGSISLRWGPGICVLLSQDFAMFISVFSLILIEFPDVRPICAFPLIGAFRIALPFPPKKILMRCIMYPLVI